MLEDKKWSLGGGVVSYRVVREGLFARVPLIRGLKVITEQTMLDILVSITRIFFFFLLLKYIFILDDLENEDEPKEEK